MIRAFKTSPIKTSGGASILGLLGYGTYLYKTDEGTPRMMKAVGGDSSSNLSHIPDIKYSSSLTACLILPSCDLVFLFVHLVWP